MTPAYQTPSAINALALFYWWTNLDEDWRRTLLRALGQVEYVRRYIRADYLRPVYSSYVAAAKGLPTYTSTFTETVYTSASFYKTAYAPDPLLYREISIVDLQRVLALRHLVVRNLQNLEPLRMLKQLTHLDCAHSPVYDLSPLAELTALKKLNCAHTLISSLEPVYELPNLIYVDVRRTRRLEVVEILTLSHRAIKIESDFDLHDNPAPIVNNPNVRPLIDYYPYVVMGFIFLLGIFVYQLFKAF